MTTPSVTLVIHGTFARNESWWRLGTDNSKSFADQLESALHDHGITDSVWKPVLNSGFDYDDFSWSGENTHKARVKGARKLRRKLEELASAANATPASPLSVNLVAHSHGGNVVLEAIRKLNHSVHINRIVLLGTPLIIRKPAFRLWRLLSSLVLLGLSVIAICVLLYFLTQAAFAVGSSLFSMATQAASAQDITNNIAQAQNLSPEIGPTQIFLIAFLYLFIVAWLFWVFAELADGFWRLVMKIVRILTTGSIGPSYRMYGPTERVLRRKLSNGGILDLRGRNDEADLLLQVTSAPERLYMEYVRSKLHGLLRLAELILFRPFILGAGLKAMEVLTERIVFGFTWPRVLFTDYGIWSPKSTPYYPRDLFRVENVASTVSHMQRDSGPIPNPLIISEDDAASAIPDTDSLSMTLAEIKDEIAAQISLRHSAYYQDGAITDRIADFIVDTPDDAPVSVVEITWPRDSFWEYIAAFSAFVFAAKLGYVALIPTNEVSWFEVFALLMTVAVFLWPVTLLTWNRFAAWQPALRWVIWLAVSAWLIYIFFFSAIPTT